jgi:hypothetical protein
MSAARRVFRCVGAAPRRRLFTVVAMASVVEEMQKRTRRQQQERQNPEQVSAVLGDQEIRGDRDKTKEHVSRNRPLAIRAVGA